MEKRCCFISYKTEDQAYKDFLQSMGINMVDRSLNKAIDSDDEDYIMRKIREENLAGSIVTIHLIGKYSAEALGLESQKFIKRELQASLYDGVNSSRSAVLGVVLPTIHGEIFKGPIICAYCKEEHQCVNVSRETTVAEFYRNYYIANDKCHHAEEDRYCVLVTWEDFIKNPSSYIEQAYLKRVHPIAQKVTVYC